MAVGLLLSAGAACAESNSPAAQGAESVATVHDLNKVQTRTFMLRAQNALDEEVQKSRERAGQGKATQKVDECAQMPVVAHVSGRSESPTAHLLYADGSIIPVKAGTALKCGYAVKSVSARTVVVTRGKVTLHLGFGMSVPRQAVVPREVAYPVEIYR
ncbi:MAG: hypothetical protein A2580_01015 [Hydrogenophilales bacterium RIFOXYD1_FULL_62_11]|nr:MAG: hypothetical protein A2580_01015 [Hydrogenophilales bacterium RIFOXYD1_FULL_62_11]